MRVSLSMRRRKRVVAERVPGDWAGKFKSLMAQIGAHKRDMQEMFTPGVCCVRVLWK